jgi:hypothetical protein
MKNSLKVVALVVLISTLAGCYGPGPGYGYGYGYGHCWRNWRGVLVCN